jgi:hypothetical protein
MNTMLEKIALQVPTSSISLDKLLKTISNIHDLYFQTQFNVLGQFLKHTTFNDSQLERLLAIIMGSSADERVKDTGLYKLIKTNYYSEAQLSLLIETVAARRYRQYSLEHLSAKCSPRHVDQLLPLIDLEEKVFPGFQPLFNPFTALAHLATKITTQSQLQCLYQIVHDYNRPSPEFDEILDAAERSLQQHKNIKD